MSRAVTKMRFNDFVKTYLGKGTDYDGAYGVQCVDLAKLFIDKVIGVVPQSIGNAHAYWDNFENTYLKKYFKPIPYKKGVKAQKGDLVVWGKKYDGKSEHGHIAIATGKQTDTTITTYDQNWGGAPMKEVTHSVTGLKGYLRPLNQENIKNKHKPNVGKSVTFTTKPYCYKRMDRKERYLICDLTKLTSTDEARLKKGTTVRVKSVKEINGDIWISFVYNKVTVCSIVYNGQKDKAYVK